MDNDCLPGKSHLLEVGRTLTEHHMASVWPADCTQEMEVLTQPAEHVRTAKTTCQSMSSSS